MTSIPKYIYHSVFWIALTLTSALAIILAIAINRHDNLVITLVILFQFFSITCWILHGAVLPILITEHNNKKESDPRPVCSECHQKIDNGQGQIKIINGIPSWSSIKHIECPEIVALDIRAGETLKCNNCKTFFPAKKGTCISLCSDCRKQCKSYDEKSCGKVE